MSRAVERFAERHAAGLKTGVIAIATQVGPGMINGILAGHAVTVETYQRRNQSPLRACCMGASEGHDRGRRVITGVPGQATEGF